MGKYSCLSLMIFLLHHVEVIVKELYGLLMELLMIIIMETVLL